MFKTLNVVNYFVQTGPINSWNYYSKLKSHQQTKWMR